MSDSQQSAAVTQAHDSVLRGRNELSETQRQLKSFDTLAQRHTEAEKIREAKIEQRQQDEHNGRRAAYKNAEQNEEQ